jgi:hypothetical protein
MSATGCYTRSIYSLIDEPLPGAENATVIAQVSTVEGDRVSASKEQGDIEEKEEKEAGKNKEE